jgi:hypothetical protein
MIMNTQTEAPKPKTLKRGAGAGLAQKKVCARNWAGRLPISASLPKARRRAVSAYAWPSVGSRYRRQRNLFEKGRDP